MVKDKKGQLYTEKEFLGKSINEVQIDIKDTEALMKRIDNLIMKFEKTKECEQAYKKLDLQYDKISALLRDEDKKLVTDLDDYFTEILILFEEYFYVLGYKDGIRANGLFKRFVRWITDKFSL